MKKNLHAQIKNNDDELMKCEHFMVLWNRR